MTLAQLLGLPPGWPDPITDAPALRSLLVAAALAWAWLAGRGRRTLTLAAGIAFVWIALGFWTATFGRPYGLFEAAAPTREAAYAVRAASPGGLQGFVVGQPYAGGAWASLARAGVPIGALLALPTGLPLFTLPLSALLIAALWRSRAATLAATLWLGFSTTDLEALHGYGFVPGLWAHPAASLGVLALVAACLLAAPRSGRPTRSAVAAALALLGLLACYAPGEQAPAPWQLPQRLLLDPWPWPLLAAWGLRRGAPGARAPLAAGALLALAAALGLPLSAWAGLALYRLGLLLASAEALQDALERASALAAQRMPALAGRPGLGLALALAVLLPGGFLAWWHPVRLDPAAHASLAPPTPSLLDTAWWMRAHLPPEAVVVASAEYAPEVTVVARRRVLRMPGVLPTADDMRRERVESALFVPGAQGARNAERYGVSHLLVGPGDAQRWGFAGEVAPPIPGRFRLLYAHPAGFRVYALAGW